MLFRSKQAMGVYVTNYDTRMDKTAYVLTYPHRPLVDTRVMNLINLNSIPSGCPVIVAIMTYSGYMSQALLTSIASVLKQQIEQDHLPKKVMRNIFSVFVEQYENVVRYSDDQIEEEGKDDVRYGIMAISKKKDSYILNCGNVIKSEERVNSLRERLESLKNMSDDDLKAFYKQKLRADSEEGSKGAGVGLIEIARKSSEFDFDFIDLNDGTSFFLLRSILK